MIAVGYLTTDNGKRGEGVGGLWPSCVVDSVRTHGYGFDSSNFVLDFGGVVEWTDIP